MANLKDLFDKARAASEHRSYTRGLLGKPDGTIAVPSRPTHVYVRVSQAGGESVTTARNLNVVPLRLNLPVKMRIEPGAGYVIVGLDSTAYEAAVANDTTSPYGVPFHTHKLGSGLSYEMEAMRLEPGRVYPTGSWGITVNPFRYWWNGVWETYEGEDLDLLTNRPTTTGKHRLVVISVNPLTNVAAKTNGSEELYATTLAQPDIDAISIGNNIPLCAVRIRADDTSIDDITRYIDAGGWRNRGATALSELIDVALTTPADNDVLTYDSGDAVWKNVAPAAGLSFSDAEGQPADVAGANADGTSAYAARRDHVHTIAAGAVSSSMLADGAALAEILDDDGAGSGLDADLLDGSHAAAFATAAHTHAGDVAAVSLMTDWSYRNTNRSNSSYAWKGNEFTPDFDVEIYAIAFYGGLAATATYQAAVVTGTGTAGNVATITKSNSITMPSGAESDGGWLWLEFATPVTLTAGSTYGLLVGRTDGADTYVLPVPYNGTTSSIGAVPIPGISHGRTWRIAKANPAVGDAIDRITTDSIGAGYRWRIVGSLY